MTTRALLAVMVARDDPFRISPWVDSQEVAFIVWGERGLSQTGPKKKFQALEDRGVRWGFKEKHL